MADKFYVPSDYGFIDCDKVKVTGYDFPDVVFGNRWNAWITFEEDEDEETYVSVEACPAWIIYDISPGRVDFTGVPDKKEYIGDVVLNISLSNCMENDPSGEGHDSVVGQFEVLCVPAAVTGSSFPTATWMVAWSGWVTFEGTDPLNLAVTACPSWASYTIGEDRIDFSGTPDVPGTATFTYTYQNCGYDTETATNSVTVECTNVAVASSSFPDVEFGKAWTGYVTFSGTTPYTLAVTSCPSWVSYTIGTARIDFSGTPTDSSSVGSSTITYTYANCAAAATTGTATFEVTCREATIASTSNMDAEISWGDSWTGSITVAPGSGDYEVDVKYSSSTGAINTDWVSWSQSGNTFTFTGICNPVTFGSHSSVTFSVYFYLTSCGTQTLYRYPLTINASYHIQQLTSSTGTSGTFTVPEGFSWLRVWLVPGATGSAGIFEGLWTYALLPTADETPNYLSSSAGGVTSLGGVESPQVLLGWYVSNHDSYTFGGCTYYDTFTTYYATRKYTDSWWEVMWPLTNIGCSEFTWNFTTYNGSSYTINFNDENNYGRSCDSISGLSLSDYYGDEIAYSNYKTGDNMPSDKITNYTFTAACDNDVGLAFTFSHTAASPGRLVYMSVTPGATYSFTLGRPGYGCRSHFGYSSLGSLDSTGIGTSMTSSTTTTEDENGCYTHGGTGYGVIQIEWGSNINWEGHNGHFDNNVAYPVATTSLKPLSAEEVAVTADAPNTYDASRIRPDNADPKPAGEAGTAVSGTVRAVVQSDDENTES